MLIFQRRWAIEDDKAINNIEGVNICGKDISVPEWIVFFAIYFLSINESYNLKMGNCVSNNKKLTLDKDALDKIRKIISDQEIYILHLMYKDLADRTVDRKINLQNFLLFFHKNGYWGQRLFKEFDFDETNLISEEEFIRGIAKIFKSSEKDKISLLFKFFSKSGKDSEGVFFNQFLLMLYNYPKQDLKQILNDKQFIEFELKKSMVLIDGPTNGMKHNTYRLESISSLKENGVRRGTYEASFQSIVGKNCIRSIKDKYITNETIVSFRDGDKVYDIRTSNIQQLVKKFARRIFEEAKIDVQEGKLNFYQFYSWISIHPALYQNYYNGFHNLIWEIDPLSHKPKYLHNACEKISEARLAQEDSLRKVRLFLYQSILVVTESGNIESPIEVISLEGLTVKRIYEDRNGFGFQISHRDGIYEEKKIFLKNQALLCEWMSLLKFYKGESVQQRYEIGKKIGTGKFSLVYRCRHIAEDKEYALKEIATFKLQAEAKELIAHQSSIMQIVSHPLLLEFKECVQTKTHIYIVTELVKGNDLFDFVKESQYLDEYDAAKITQQLIVGIRFLHSFEIVHRDLKPENIMVVIDEDSQEISNIKIIDFGFSNYLFKLQQKSSEENFVGTPNYIAPQVLRNQPFGFEIDNFAIGVILYFMLSGTLPFNDYTILAILQNTIKGEYRFGDRCSLSNESMDLIDQLLKNNPSERITLAEALKHPWFQILKSPKSKGRRVKRSQLYEFK